MKIELQGYKILGPKKIRFSKKFKIESYKREHYLQY